MAFMSIDYECLIHDIDSGTLSYVDAVSSLHAPVEGFLRIVTR